MAVGVIFPLGSTMFHSIVYVLHETSGDAVLELAFCSYHVKDRSLHLEVITTNTGHTPS